MTCGKCEKIISEGLIEALPDISQVVIDQAQGKAQVNVQECNDAKEEKILSIINALVNGKFKAKIDKSKYYVISFLEVTELLKNRQIM